MLDLMLNYSDNPYWLIAVVVVSTFMLEDLAIIGAGLLAASGKMNPEVAFVAVLVGMTIGDTALYLLGRATHLWPWLAEKLDTPMIQAQVIPLQHTPWQQLMLIRCMPGLRTFGYIACGIAKVPLGKFTLANSISIFVWAAGIFMAALYLGRQYAENLEQWLWWLLPVVLVIFILGQRKVRQSLEAEIEESHHQDANRASS